jgi:hypothetical protein
MGRLKPGGLAVIHLTFPVFFPPPIEGEPDATEKAALGQLIRREGSRYAQM